ncbi:DUF4412 domain-containing protein [Oscillatoria laete-virens NRMC-F 0139]|nr:DUF4412 domain-containing protein [Oscillatoria laete-virens NRMC-F 0139]
MPLFIRALSALVIFLSVAAADAAQEINIPESFSVDQTATVEGMDAPVKIRFFFDKDKWRYEVRQGEQMVVTIARKDQGLQYTLFPETKRYFVAPLLADLSPTSSWREPDAEWTLQGKETVRTIPCEKYRVVSKGLESFVWVSEDKKAPVRVQTADGKSTLDMDNFVEGPQPEELFVVPEDYSLLEVQVGTPEDAMAP